MPKTLNQYVEAMLGRMALQIATLEQQLEVSLENSEKLTAELAKLKANPKPE